MTDPPATAEQDDDPGSQRTPAPMLDVPMQEVIDRLAEVERRLREAQAEIETLRARLARAEQEATTDSLTGIPNRRGFLALLREAARAADADGQTLSLLMVDVDHFKEFNDRFGHHVGDHVLRLVAHALKGVRAQDPTRPAVSGRYGGEEFAVVLPGIEAAGASRIADRLREDLAERRFIMRGTGEPLTQITISIGLAERHRDEDPAETLRRADQALYEAKRRGRNRVEPLRPEVAPIAS